MSFHVDYSGTSRKSSFEPRKGRRVWVRRHARALTALTVAAAALCVAGVRAQGDTPRIWEGVYTTEQAELGKKEFATNCASCHGETLTGRRGPALAGERFMTTWGGSTLDGLFNKMRDDMPPTMAGSLTDEAYAGILAMVLQANGFPAGKAPISVKADGRLGEEVRILAKAGGVPNFAIVQVVGCLVQAPNDRWLLASATEPVVTKVERGAEGTERASLATAPLGGLTVRLISSGPFKKDLQPGKRVEAKGLLYREPNEVRVNLTSLQSLGVDCGR